MPKKSKSDDIQEKERSLFETSLFFGLLINPSLQRELDLLDPSLKSLFIQEGGAYLKEYSLKEAYFLGKFIGQKSNLPHLDLLSSNILSLLKKLVPHHEFDPAELLLIPVVN